MADINLSTGIVPTSQIPLDSKAYFKTLASMQDLGTNNFKAFIYYESLVVICVETNKKYIWRERVIGDGLGVLELDYEYPEDAVSNGINYSERRFNFFEYYSQSSANRILSGNVVPDGAGDLGFISTIITFLFNNQLYIVPSTELELDEGGEEDRIDVFAVDVDGTLKVIQGEESENPLEPSINFETQIRVSAVLIKAGQNSGDGILSLLLYDENLGSNDEWDVEAYGFGSGTIELDSELDPYSGEIHIYNKGLANGNKGLSITQGEFLDLINFSEYEGLSFFLKLREEQSPSGRFLLKLVNLGETEEAVANGNLLLTNLNIDINNLEDYQLVVIPFSLLNVIGTQFNNIVLEFQGINTCYIDKIELYGGLENPVQENTYLGLDDTDDTNYIRKQRFVPEVNQTESGLILKKPFWFDIEDAKVQKLITNTNFYSIEIGDKVYFKVVETEIDSGEFLTLFGHTYLGGNKLIHGSYEQQQSIDI